MTLDPVFYMPFSDIIGHNKEIGILKKCILQGRIPHALLFAGHAGIGKRLTAIAFAKALNCKNLEDDFCDECNICKGIDNSSFMDVFLVEPREPDSKGGEVNHTSGTIRVEHITSLQQRLSYKPQNGVKKVCIIDGAEKMNRDSHNKLLKTLEEPTRDSVIILITAKPEDLLPTVLSRCQRINFRPIEMHVLTKFICEKLNLTEEESRIIAALNSGSIGGALKTDREWVLKRRLEFIKGFEGLSKNDACGILRFSEDVSKEGDIYGILEFMAMWYRDIMISSLGRDDMVVNADMLETIKRYASSFAFEKLLNGFMAIVEARENIMPPRYANKQLTMEDLFLKLVRKYNG